MEERLISTNSFGNETLIKDLTTEEGITTDTVEVTEIAQWSYEGAGIVHDLGPEVRTKKVLREETPMRGHVWLINNVMWQVHFDAS